MKEARKNKSDYQADVHGKNVLNILNNMFIIYLFFSPTAVSADGVAWNGVENLARIFLHQAILGVLCEGGRT